VLDRRSARPARPRERYELGDRTRFTPIRARPLGTIARDA
jgi:hypothetical protein